MKIPVLIIISLFLSNSLVGQDIETAFSLESRAGYSTNTLLHPFINEWDTSAEGAFARVKPSVFLQVNTSSVSLDMGGSMIFESIFDSRDSWKGAFGSVEFRYRLPENISVGMQASRSFFRSVYEKKSALILPDISWTPNLSTRVRVKVGSLFSNYVGLTEIEGGNFSSRTDLYGLEIEYWPTFKWQIGGTVYGMFGQDPAENHSVSITTSRAIGSKTRISLSLSGNRFTNSVYVNPELNGVSSGTVNSGVNNTDTMIVSDRSLRTGLDISRSIFDHFAGFATVSHHTFWSGNGGYRSDIAVHGGLRFTFSGDEFLRKREVGVAPSWNRKNNAVIVEVTHEGGGTLYLTGDFNDWMKPGIALSSRGDKQYAAELDLEAGVYEYKVLLVENEEMKWVDISEESMTVSDGFGGTNGLIFIEDKN